MKFGVITFSYENYKNIRRQVSEQGCFSANLGDNMQSIASRLLLNRLGVPDQDIISVDRDTLASYNGPPVSLIMNGVFESWCFPTPAQVRPIFIGLCVKEKTVIQFKDYFSRFQPIGCRDTHTQQLFEKHGIAAFVTGCLTLTIPKRVQPENPGKVFVVYGSGAGAFPSSVLRQMPKDIMDRLEFVYQRIPVFKFPVDSQGCHEAETYARTLLAQYATKADLIVTPLHHAAAPAIGLGIPVIICREKMDPRFTYLSELTRIYTPESFDEIDWNPSPVDIEPVRRNLESLVSKSIVALSAS